MTAVTRRVTIAVAVYIAAVVIATLAFGICKNYLLTGHASRYAFMALGPAVSLHTHSGLSLILLQSAILLPITIVAVLSRRLRILATAAALAAWAYIGWTMAVGFLE